MYLTQGRKEGRGNEGGGETVRAGKERKGEGRREREREREKLWPGPLHNKERLM